MMPTMNLRPVFLRLKAYAAVLPFLWISGCTNLSAIQDFAAISAESAQYTRLVDQYAESPVRQKRFQPADQHERLDRMTRERAAQKDRLLLRLNLVAEYMSALGALAADEAVDYDSGIEGLERAVVDNKLAADKDADAFASVANLLLRVCTDSWRKKELQNLITASNGPFQEVVGALKRIVGLEFTGDIANEKEAMRNHYETLIHLSGDSAGIAALREWEDTRLAEADARARSDSCYARVLSSIAMGHQQLYDRRDDLGGKELVRQLKQYTNEVRKSVNAIRNL
jgi:hypothetical protein